MKICKELCIMDSFCLLYFLSSRCTRSSRVARVEDIAMDLLLLRTILLCDCIRFGRVYPLLGSNVTVF